MKAPAIIGEILAAWEDAANTAALDCHRNAEEDAERLLRYGVELPMGAMTEEREGAMRLAWNAVENGREMAKAWRTISNRLQRLLRVMRVDTYAQRRAKEANAPAKPWEKRRAVEAMAENVSAYEPEKYERAPVVLDAKTIEERARANGLWEDQ